MEEGFLKYIPLDKSWIIRMGFLDIINGYDDINKFLEKQNNLGDDLIALKRVTEKWNTDEPLDVGESGTLYRFLQFYLWKNKIKREIIKKGTLKDRKICDNPEIVNWPLKKLLTLDNGTSQWASASIINGNKERIKVPEYKDKLQLSYEAVEHWNEKRKNNECWLPRYDKTIENQARAYLGLLKNKKLKFIPKHSEDYCFARAFNLITPEQGEKMFPSLIGHETDRIKEMEKALDEAEKYGQISSKDHRVIQAIAMKYKILGKKLIVQHPYVVSKSWPQFWDFLDYCNKV